jgi:hypothetical protein
MNYEKLSFRLRSVSPLLMHSGQLADPLNPHTKAMKAISGKRKKTEADFAQLAKLEWFGSLYLHDGAPCLPGEVIEAGLIEAARKMRRGQEAKAGIISDGFFALDYDGPRDPEALWADIRFRFSTGVRVQRNRVIRTRPRFDEWTATVEVDYLPDQLNPAEVTDMMRTLGRIIGIGDWRPRFGRFELDG